jgi:hypothetical protein
MPVIPAHDEEMHRSTLLHKRSKGVEQMIYTLSRFEVTGEHDRHICSNPKPRSVRRALTG